MKIKIELDITPEEAQDLFVPSNKQKEFARAMGEAYINAVKDIATETAKRVNPLRKRDVSD